jgi:formyl-CoA transferase
LDQVLDTLDNAGVPVGKIYTAADIANDPQYLAREMVVQVTDGQGQPLKVPGVVPKLSATPGAIRYPAPGLGADTQAVTNQGGWPLRGVAGGV